MSDAFPKPSRPLPERPHLDQLRKQAKDRHGSGEHPRLGAAQLAVAREYGFASWARLKRHVELVMLRRLITEGATAPVRELLQSSPTLAKASFAEGDTPLHLAAEENRPELVELLVRHGAPFDTHYGRSAHSALSWAITCWSFDAATKLVEMGDEPDLFCAAGLGLLDAVQSFWKGGRRRRRPSRTGSSRYAESGDRLPCPPGKDEDQVSDALYIACRANRLEVARWLVDHGADPNWRAYAGATCLGWAEFSGNTALCVLLRQRGGRDDLLDTGYQATPAVFALMVYAGWGFPKLLVERLAGDRTLVSSRGGRGTLLHAAAESGQQKTAELLVLLGADKTARDPAGQTAAEVAAAKGHHALAEALR